LVFFSEVKKDKKTKVKKDLLCIFSFFTK